MSQIDRRIAQLVDYGVTRGMIEPEDGYWAVNGLLAVLGRDSFQPPEEPIYEAPLEEILEELLDDAQSRGLVGADTASRDLMSSTMMAFLTPRPSQMIDSFWRRYRLSPRKATEWFYDMSRHTDYIRSYRVVKDLRWNVDTDYGPLDITINLSKPEKDPGEIAAAREQKGEGYPKCLLCREAEGYVGRPGYPGRANHRLIPIRLNGNRYYMQYSPYVYYNEHCIVLSEKHVPMKLDKDSLLCLLDFVRQFPHYFMGSNAELPIVGASILSHHHFQGGCYSLPMEKAPVERELSFQGFTDVEAGIVRWPMPVIRLRSPESSRLAELGDRIITAWRGYSDPDLDIYAFDGDRPLNTITPIARRRGEDYELDLVLRNAGTSPEHPLGIFHPHEELYHIKKENIGLIEVMGLAVLPSRLERELGLLAQALREGGDLYAREETAKHAQWAKELMEKYDFTKQDPAPILRRELGKVFLRVLEDAAVFKRDERGRLGLLRFLDSLG